MKLTDKEQKTLTAVVKARGGQKAVDRLDAEVLASLEQKGLVRIGLGYADATREAALVLDGRPDRNIFPPLPAPTPEQLREADKEEEQADGHLAANQRRVAEQLDAMDCALSWACDDLSAGRHRAQADVLRQGGFSVFHALFDAATDRRVPAKLIDGTYGPCWALLDARGEFTGKFISAFPRRLATMVKKGYYEGYEAAPAKAVIGGNGRGLSGLATAFVTVRRTDGGCPTDVLERRPS